MLLWRLRKVRRRACAWFLTCSASDRRLGRPCVPRFHHCVVSSTLLRGSELTLKFDSVKSRLQVKSYPSAWACFRAVVREEGVRGLFRGVTIPLVTISFVRTTSFSIYTDTKHVLEKYFGSNEKRELGRTAVYGLLGGLTSGSIISIFSAPFELVKVQRQLEFLIASQRVSQTPGGSSAPFRPMTGWQAAREIYTMHGGMRGFYMGLRVHMIRDMGGSALYYCIYDTLRVLTERLGDKLRLPGPLVPFMTGSASGILSWFIIYPMDMIKTQIQRNALAGAPRLSAYKVFEQLLFQQPGDGASGKRRLRDVPIGHFLRLYRGLGISALRSLISHGMSWMIIETILGQVHYGRQLSDDDEAADFVDYQ